MRAAPRPQAAPPAPPPPPPPSPERQALAAALADVDAARQRLDALRAGQERANDELYELVGELDRAERELREARQHVPVSYGGDAAPAADIEARIADLQAAIDKAMVLAAAFATDLPAAELQQRFAEMARDRVLVLAVADDPAVAALAQELALALAHVETLTAILAMIPGGRPTVFAGPIDYARVREWREALQELKQDAEARLPDDDRGGGAT